MAYFDNAATTFPKPEPVYEFMNSFYRSSGGNAGRGIYVEAEHAGKLIAETRKGIQSILHCPAKQVVFQPTATIALNVIIQGVVGKGAKNIYITPFEHNAVTRVLHHLEQTAGIRVEILAAGDDLKYDLERIHYQFDALNPDFVIVSHASNAFGVIAPVEKIFELAKRYDAVTLADMSQTAGLVDVNVGLQTFDFAVFAGHKTLYGPTGISGFVMNPVIDIPPLLFGGTGFESANQNMPDSLPQRFECGTLNIAGIAGLYAATQWIAEMSVEKIRAREIENREALLDVLRKYSFIRIIGDVEGDFVGIVSCVIDGISSDTAAMLFNERGISVRTGLQCAPLAHKFMGTYPAGTIRFSTSFFTDNGDFKALDEALSDIQSEM